MANKKRKIVALLGGIIGFILVYFLLQHFIFPSTDRILQESVERMNKNYPMMIDEYTRIDEVTIPSDKTIQYNYTLVSLTKEEFNKGEIQEQIEPFIINGVKSDPQMKELRDKGITFIYFYQDKNGEFAYQFRVTPEMYNAR